MDTPTSRELDTIRLRTQADVQRAWALLIDPLGFTRRSLWVTCVEADGRLVRSIAEIEDDDGHHDDAEIDNLYACFADVLRDAPPGTRLAFLISRPGAGPVDADDTRFARQLVSGARRHGVPIEPVHLAHDVAIVPITPHDLAA